MKSLGVPLFIAAIAFIATAQNPVIPSASAGGASTVIGCLSWPGGDNYFTLTSMQHRTGVELVCERDSCAEQLKNASGAKVQLTGSWQTIPGYEGKAGDSVRRFKVTEVAVVDDKCSAPQPVTPLSKKKQSQEHQ
jgi:hypothetical protein